MGIEMILALVGAATGIARRVTDAGVTGFDDQGKALLVNMLSDLAVAADAGKEMRAKMEGLTDDQVDDILTR